MTAEESNVRMLAKLLEIAGFIETFDWPPFDPDRECIAFFHLACTKRHPRLLRAVHLLVTNGFDSEADAVARPLTEMAVNAAWIGRDELRAKRWYAEGLRYKHRWLESFLRTFNGLPQDYRATLRSTIRTERANCPEVDPLPSISDRLKVSGSAGEKLGHGFLRHAYDAVYARQCAVSHLSTMAQGNLIAGVHPQPTALQDVLWMSTVILIVQGEVLDITAVSRFADDLMHWTAKKALG